MSERFAFAVDGHIAVDRHLVSVDGSVVWQQDNLANSTLADTINEGYVTAEEDSPTQYLSVLDSTNEISLDNLNMSLANPKLEVEETFIADEMLDVGADAGEQQVVVYTVEGSDELYGIQIAQDEDGNLQKYQFQFRKNADGQLEAIPDTVQLLPMDEDVQQVVGVDNLEQQDDSNVQIFVQEDHATEQILPDQNEVEDEQEHPEHEESMLYENDEVEDEIIDIKPAVLNLQNIKQELLEAGAPPDYVEPLEEAFGDNEIPESELYENCVESEDNPACEDYEEKTGESEAETAFEHIEINPDVDLGQSEETMEAQPDENNANDSDADDYQIVEGLHITGDVDTGEDVGEKSVQTANSAANILKHALNTYNDQKPKKDKLYLYVVHPEKENVDSLSMEMSNLCRPKVNPRSILKSSHVLMQTKNDIQTQEEKMNRRFARCKEAVQARNFHNFINKTTIPQAPVRKDRLPRKQQIKPVERIDEEIVVQEVMVSSNRFVEMYGGAALVNKENLEVTEYVELSDSDDDYNPKKVSKKKKKHRRRKIEITISDESDSSHESIIELDESDDGEEHESSSDKHDTPPKRGRGRPPKTPTSDDAKTGAPETSPKRSRLEATDFNTTKPEIPCPRCDKTFPSQNSLKTHLQHHNLQTTLRNALPEPKYKCVTCDAAFKNAIMLKRHACLKSFPCPVCRKKFPDASTLNVHRRIHAKEQLMKSTAAVQVSPKKIKPISPSGKRTTKQFKCRTCGKTCSSLQNLNVHAKTHKEYACATCAKTFASQLVFEKHVREMCVKSPKRQTRSLLAPTLRSRNVASPALARLRRVKCDKCELEFASHQAMVKHQAASHAVDTVDTSVLREVKRTTCMQRGIVPTSRGLKDVFAGMKCQLDSMK